MLLLLHSHTDLHSGPMGLYPYLYVFGLPISRPEHEHCKLRKSILAFSWWLKQFLPLQSHWDKVQKTMKCKYLTDSIGEQDQGPTHDEYLLPGSF